MTALVSHLKIADIYWDGDAFGPPIADLGPAGLEPGRLEAQLGRIEGQFAVAAEAGDRVVLIRDKHGVNKLFFAIREDGTVVAANYIADLVDSGVPYEAVFSVPSGHFTTIDASRQSLKTTRYYTVPGEGSVSLEEGARAVRNSLELWFGRLARVFRDREICICLSGGLDSSLVAALARRSFSRVTAFTYSFEAGNGALSEDARYAQQVAEHLRIPLQIIRTTREDILGAAGDALVYGQDWRDFNVHCAVVNEVLAGAISAYVETAEDGADRLVLTGDMMNEILADYTPISYGGEEYYTLPRLEIEQLRRILVKGLDTGDREVGVFGRRGLDIVQPYGFVLDRYLAIPLASIGEEGKQRLVREVAGDLLPELVLGRSKVRAQIGTSDEPTGILPLFVAAGWDSAWLKRSWCERFATDEKLLGRVVRGGMYRALSSFPGNRGIRNGYLTG